MWMLLVKNGLKLYKKISTLQRGQSFAVHICICVMAERSEAENFWGWKLEGRAFPPLGIRRGDFFVGRGEFDKGDVSPLGIWGDFLWTGEI